jgi:hypothetical protein
MVLIEDEEEGNGKKEDIVVKGALLYTKERAVDGRHRDMDRHGRSTEIELLSVTSTLSPVKQGCSLT